MVFQPDSGHVIAFDAWLHEHYYFEPRIKLYLYNDSLLPHAVVGTQRLATLSLRLAQLYAKNLPDSDPQAGILDAAHDRDYPVAAGAFE